MPNKCRPLGGGAFKDRREESARHAGRGAIHSGRRDAACSGSAPPPPRGELASCPRLPARPSDRDRGTPMKILSPEETILCRRAARMEPDMAGWLLCASWLADQGGTVDAELVRVYVELRQGPPPGEW